MNTIRPYSHALWLLPHSLLPGELHIGKLASSHGLTVPDMENALASRLGTFIHGRVERQVLFTTAFIQKQTATIIGALTATTRPTSTLDIIQRFRLQPELFETTLKQVMIPAKCIICTVACDCFHLFAFAAHVVRSHQRRAVWQALHSRLVHSGPETRHQRVLSIKWVHLMEPS